MWTVVAISGFVLLMMIFRRVVPNNQVMIVNRRKTSTSYGNGQEAGNVFYDIPAFIPYFGVEVIALSTTVFDIQLDGYSAYDIGKVPLL
ncbi:MAG: hypothetical protein HC798_04765 [Polaribacter sp.]|nr:hypothetical protein [Polaribacter sp.]